MRRVSANKNVLSSRLNSVRQMSCCRSSAGRLFHSRGPAIPKLLSPSLDCVRGTVHVWTSADRRCRRPASVTSWQSSDRYAGARRWSDLYTSTMTLKSIRCLTGSQWSCLCTGVMCQIKNPIPLIGAYLREENSCQIYPDPISNTGAWGRPNMYNNKMSSSMRSAPDLKYIDRPMSIFKMLFYLSMKTLLCCKCVTAGEGGAIDDYSL